MSLRSPGKALTFSMVSYYSFESCSPGHNSCLDLAAVLRKENLKLNARMESCMKSHFRNSLLLSYTGETGALVTYLDATQCAILYKWRTVVMTYICRCCHVLLPASHNTPVLSILRSTIQFLSKLWTSPLRPKKTSGSRASRPLFV